MNLFHLPDGRDVPAGTPFSAYVTLKPGPPPLRDMVQFPANWLALATPADLARIGVTVREIPDAPPSVDQLIAYAADRRRSLANGSAVISTGTRSIPVWTDNASQTAVLALLPRAQADSNFVRKNWKGADGNFYNLTAAEIIAIYYGGLEFIGTCFDAEAEITSRIAAGTITTFEEIDAFAWPSTT